MKRKPYDARTLRMVARYIRKYHTSIAVAANTLEDMAKREERKLVIKAAAP